MQQNINLFEFAYANYLYLLLVIPVLVLVFVVAIVSANRKKEKFADYQLLYKLTPQFSATRRNLKFIYLTIALALIIVALAGPRIGAKLKEVKTTGIEAMILLDVSNSMLAEDLNPNRLNKAKLAIERLLPRLQNDNIGLIVFAGDAYVQVPMTNDYGAVQMFLQSVNTDIVPNQGTAIGAAIDLAMSSFSPNNENSKAIIIITDGENHEDNAIELAQKAADENINIYTIGMGTPAGSPIPIGNDFRKDRTGKTIITKLNEKMLVDIATAGNGTYIRASNSRVGLNKIYDQLDEIKQMEMKAKTFEEFDEKFHLWVIPALLILLLDFFTQEKRNKSLRKFKLFKDRFID